MKFYNTHYMFIVWAALPHRYLPHHHTTPYTTTRCATACRVYSYAYCRRTLRVREQRFSGTHLPHPAPPAFPMNTTTLYRLLPRPPVRRTHRHYANTVLPPTCLPPPVRAMPSHMTLLAFQLVARFTTHWFAARGRGLRYHSIGSRQTPLQPADGLPQTDACMALYAGSGRRASACRVPLHHTLPTTPTTTPHQHSNRRRIRRAAVRVHVGSVTCVRFAFSGTVPHSTWTTAVHCTFMAMYVPVGAMRAACLRLYSTFAARAPVVISTHPAYAPRSANSGAGMQKYLPTGRHNRGTERFCRQRRLYLSRDVFSCVLPATFCCA